MGAITTPDPIYASDINNFQGELFKVGGQRTPFLSAMGGLTGGGKVIQSTFFQFQTADNATISSAPTEGTEGGAPTEYLGRNRGAYTQVTQIFHKGVKMSYTAMAAYNQQNPFTVGAAGYPASDGDGTTTNTAQLALTTLGSASSIANTIAQTKLTENKADITGTAGILGRYLTNILEKLGFDPTSDKNITNATSVPKKKP